jgi:hypothetical protein
MPEEDYESQILTVSDFVKDNSKGPGRPVLERDEAEEYIKDAKEKFLSGNYGFNMYRRTKSDPKWMRYYDYAVFLPEGRKIGFITRKKGEHRIIINDPAGMKPDKVTEKIWPEIRNTLKDDNLKPYVVFDEQGDEAAVIYIGKGTKLRQHFSENGLIRLHIKVR